MSNNAGAAMNVANAIAEPVVEATNAAAAAVVNNMPVPNGVQGGIAPITPSVLYFLILISYMLMMIVNRFDLYLREAVMLIMPIMVVGSIAHYYPKELQFPGPGTFGISFAAAFLMLATFSIIPQMRTKLRDPDAKGNTAAAALVYFMVAMAFAIAMYLSLQFGKGPFFFKM